MEKLSFSTLAGGGVEEKLQFALDEVAANIADPGAWRIEAMKRIKAYLEKQLMGISGIVILG